MTDAKTAAEHIESLKDDRQVYLDGKPVGDVTVHPAFAKSIASAASLYDFPGRPGKPGPHDLRLAQDRAPGQSGMADADLL